MCSKIKYDSIKPAQVAAKNMARRHGGRFNAYYCKDCHAWEVGHTPGENPGPWNAMKRALALAKPGIEPILRKRRLD